MRHAIPALALAFTLGCSGGQKGNQTGGQEGAQATSPLKVQVVTAPELLGAVNSALLIGDDDVVVVDAQFSKSGATMVVEAVKATGKPLSRVFITHAHPDHYLGTATLKEAFPDATFIASPDVASAMTEAVAMAVPRTKSLLGPEFPGDPVIPTAYDKDTLKISGRSVSLMNGLQGDTEPITGLWLEDQGVLIASDVAFSGVHAWTADTDNDKRSAWMKQLDQLGQLSGLKQVIPGHQIEDADQSPAVLSATSEYLGKFNDAADQANDSRTLIGAMNEAYPDMAGKLFLQIGAGARFPSE